MRRKISLYIGNQLVDLDDQSFILFNYTMDDLSNPTIVKNSFSQQITLKGTPRNNKVFGESFKTDRRIANTGGNTGVDFNASQKTPFTIYNERNEILESGYVKLDSISRQGQDIQYKISLFGGLGSFFYALSYDENGNKRTLADLDYMGTGNPESELDFSITKENVQAAWTRLRQGGSGTSIWDIINFAPAYNGIPDGNFSPDKGLIVPSDVGLQDSISVEDVAYTTRAGYALVNLAEAQDEWAVKDLRSYLQRPVFSMKALWNAISNSANNGGYVVDASVVTDWERFGKYASLWMTLPMISSIGTIKEESGDLSLTLSSTASSGNTIGRFDIVGSVPSGTRVTANLNCKIRFNVSGADSYSSLSIQTSRAVGRNTEGKLSAIFIQAVAYGSDNSVVGGSKIKFGGVSGGSFRGADLASACGYTPAWLEDYVSVNINSVTKKSSGVFEIPVEMGFSISAQDVAYYKILVSVYPGTSLRMENGGGSSLRFDFSGSGNTSTPELYADYDTGFTPSSTFIVAASANSASYTTANTLRSGATITKSMLLSTSHTPAEYILSFCKIFGLYFTYNPATRKITILKREDMYQDETIDLTSRVDVSKGISIQPMVFNAKWYDFVLESVGGAFNDEYEDIEGIPYGIQRVNTGYDFNADHVDLMESVVFKNACTILARSRYFNYIFKSDSTDIETPVDLTQYSVVHKYIDASGVWKSASGSDCIFIPVNPGEKYRFHIGTSTGYVAVLQSNSNTANTSASFSATYPARFQPTEGQDIVVPSDAHYIYMVRHNSTLGDVDTTISLVTRRSTIFQPSPFLDKGNTFTLWSAAGETLETDISCPPTSANVEYYNENPNLKGYDVNSARKLELRNAENKPIAGADILVFLEGWDQYPYFKLTDDVPAMDVDNDGVPCWLLGAGESGQNSLYIPTFQRYSYGNIALIEDSLDFGIPRQFDIPNVRHSGGCTIYERYWKGYMSDRYDANTKVMTCRVNFGGIQVSQDLLRKFYWYDNSLWVLNRIKNYSLTTFDPVECEFVQVQDKDNYIGSSENYYLSVSRSEFSVGHAASTLIVQVSANVSWSAQINGSFLTISPSTGDGDGTIEVAIAANATSSSRTGTITLTCTSGQSVADVVVTIVQMADSQHLMSVSPTSFNIGSPATTLILNVESDVSWRLETTGGFMTLSQSTGTGNQTIQVGVSVNTSSARTGTITLINTSGEGLPDVQVTISQAAGDTPVTEELWIRNPDIPGTTATITINANSGGFNTEIHADAAWKLVANDNWLHLYDSHLNPVSQITGVAVDRMTQYIGVDENTTGSQRVGTLTISLIDDPSVSMDFIVTQNA